MSIIMMPNDVNCRPGENFFRYYSLLDFSKIHLIIPSVSFFKETKMKLPRKNSETTKRKIALTLLISRKPIFNVERVCDIK